MSNNQLVKIGSRRYVGGAHYGLRSPSILLAVSVTDQAGVIAQRCERRCTQLTTCLTGENVSLADPGMPPPDAVIDYLATWLTYFYQAANYPVFEKAKIIGQLGEYSVVAVPVYGYHFKAPMKVLEYLVALLNTPGEINATKFARQFEFTLTSLKSALSIGSNIPRFLKAAFEANIPSLPITKNVIQYGQGARNRWLDSTFTDRTSNISAMLSRNKFLTCQLLSQSGLPVTKQAMVTSAEQAQEQAAKMGFPVVIKPADRDGGVGVAAGLMTESEVRKAFQSAEKLSKNVLLEKHIPGRDFRLNVFEGELLWAIERVPAGVTGDGQRSIAQLIEDSNRDPRRGEGMHSPLKKLVLDEEATGALTAQGLTPESIPHQGKFVSLRRRANIAMGGMPVSVMGKIHPDNILLAIRAARALKLDIAGIDIIMPDISRSWKECGGCICEVNGQPQLGGVTSAHVYGEILTKLIPGDGRLSTTLVLGAPPGSTLVKALCLRLQEETNLNLGWSDGSGVYLGADRLLDENITLFRAGQLLQREDSAEALVLSLDDSNVLLSGLPFDRFDTLVIAGSHITPISGNGIENEAQLMRSILMSILPNCTGQVFASKTTGIDAGSFSTHTPAEWSELPTRPEDAIEKLVATIIHNASLHGA